MNIKKLIAAFGGVAKMAAATGIGYPTIAAWKKTGTIGGPKATGLQRKVLDAAIRHDIPLTAADIIGVRGK